MCAGITLVGEGAERVAPLTPVTARVVPARRVIFRQRDMQDVVAFICEGWAAAVVTLSDGSRQILSFLLPGDIVSPSAIVDPIVPYLVEAVSDVEYRCFARDEVKARMSTHPSLLERMLQVWLDYDRRVQQLAVDLGRRTAEERIARLILGLRERLEARGLVRGESMDFPLRQHHVADATGLTAVHVSKVLTEFRRRGLIDIQDRSLTILSVDEFQRVAALR